MKKTDVHAVVDLTDGTYDAAFPGENREIFGDNSYDGWIESFYNHCEIILPNDECILAFSIDTHFAAQDIFAANKEFYETYMPYTKTMIGVGAVCGVIFLLMLVWMTAAAGRRPEDEEVHLAFFDRIYTEIAAVLVIGGWAGGIWFLLETLNAIYDNNAAGMLGAFGGDGIRPGIWFAVAAAVYTAVLFWTGYLSLVRRIKAHTFWKNSICGKCLKLAVCIWKKYISGKFFKFVIHIWKKYVCGLFRSISRTAKGLAQFYSRNVPARMKLTAELAVFFLGQFFCIMLIFLAGAPIFLLFMAAFYVVEFFRLAKKAIGHDRIVEGLQKISSGEIQYKIPEEGLTGDQQLMAEYINNIGSGLDAAVENSLKNERMKTELITNVSHDIKTPLTSIINYVDLLKRENFTDPKICGYLDVLEEKSQRLKTLTEDVVEASKASTGNITLEMADLDFVEMIQQVIGEFEEKFNDKGLTMMVHFPDEPSVIRADGRRMWRVLENIFNNTAKYAMEGTRVYAEIVNDKNKVTFSLKNISAQALNISADELTERFIRGDVSRNTEGSGLGLSIAKSLTELQGGEFKLYVDGDLFKVMITFCVQNS